ncbi:hypothetical protein DRE_00299 [Drechslerella stenobrocha 248]|uniref:Lipocalin-like domain-containing protein n=1 Tax=Drechslerella stenobrocha 248 TaxID=1043628 RepID=W7HTA5_9PEZI|nr:hypothetical protein DRE_00299 [Drechslerella stenobrocha 248]
MPAFSTFRQPGASFPDPPFPSLTPQSLLGEWWVTTSTLPMWKSAKNITITYSTIPSDPTSIDDTVQYFPRSANLSDPDKAVTPKSIRGVDYPLTSNSTDLSYKWRGRGWLMIATSKWQVVGYGGEAVHEVDGVLQGVDWVVTFFEKSLFTPAGVDIMTVGKGGVDAKTLQVIQDALKENGSVLAELQSQMFEIPRD